MLSINFTVSSKAISCSAAESEEAHGGEITPNGYTKPLPIPYGLSDKETSKNQIDHPGKCPTGYESL